jgi:hypothetical protein
VHETYETVEESFDGADSELEATRFAFKIWATIPVEEKATFWRLCAS